MAPKVKTNVVCDSESFLADKNNFYYSNEKLKRAGLKLQFTDQQIQEIKKCKNDMFYFIENYVKIISTQQGGMVPMKLFPYQRELLGKYRDNRYVIAMQGNL